MRLSQEERDRIRVDVHNEYDLSHIDNIERAFHATRHLEKRVSRSAEILTEKRKAMESLLQKKRSERDRDVAEGILRDRYFSDMFEDFWDEMREEFKGE